jgi:phosphoribosyl-AMP cyclohydrolase / phosphoribosyl-ATP pyrophosphohydrolase
MSRLPLKFDAQGLVPVIVQDRVTGEIRLFAFATDAAVRTTVETGRATFWSRSRGELWQRGRVSGHETTVLEVLADCDANCLIYSSDPQSASCNSGAPSCFFQALDGERLVQTSQRPQTMLAALEAALASGAKLPGDAPYAKVREKAADFVRAVDGERDERVVSEAADTIYHVLVGLRSRSIALRRVLVELGHKLVRGGHEASAPALDSALD